MGAISNRRVSEIKRSHLGKTQEVRTVHQHFTRKRKSYLMAVIQKDWKVAELVERNIIQRLAKMPKWKQVVENEPTQKTLIFWLRRGAPLSNAIAIAEKQLEYDQIMEKRIPTNPRFRKPEVLQKEIEMMEMEYQTLKLSLIMAEKNGLEAVAKETRWLVEQKAKKIAEYRKLFRERLVEN